VVDAINRGQVWRYLSKPWEPEELKQTLLQAAERTQLKRGLDSSRQSLEQALLSLKASEWARSRLFQILLHEFRTAPTVLDAALSVERLPETSARFLNQLRTRFEQLNQELSNLLDDEKLIQSLGKSQLMAQEFFGELLRSTQQVWADPDSIPHQAWLESHGPTLRTSLVEIYELLGKNTAGELPTFFCRYLPNQSPNLDFGWSLSSSKLMPLGLAQEKIDAALAWRLLFEPFVGALPFEHHSQGLRLEAARSLRRLGFLGHRSRLVTDETIQIHFSAHLFVV
jgi:hypothetical protein